MPCVPSPAYAARNKSRQRACSWLSERCAAIRTLRSGRSNGASAVASIRPVQVLGKPGRTGQVDAWRDATATDNGEVQRLGGRAVAPATEVLAQSIFDEPAERLVGLGGAPLELVDIAKGPRDV